MAVTQVREITKADNLVLDAAGEISCVRTFQVDVNDPGDDSIVVSRHRLVPKPFQSHPRSPRLTASIIEIDKHPETRLMYLVQARYKTGIANVVENPLRRPAAISMSSTERRVWTTRDANGDPMTTTAGELLDAYETEITDLTFHVAKNLPGVPRWLLGYTRSTNIDAVNLRGYNIEPGLLRFRSPRISDKQTENGVDFYVFSFDLAHRVDGWERVVPNAGYVELITSLVDEEVLPNGTTRTLDPPEERTRWKKIEVDGQEPTKPQFLSLDGKALTEDELFINAGTPNAPVRKIRPGAIKFNKYQMFKKLPYRRLPLR